MPSIVFESGHLEPKVKAELVERLTTIAAETSGIARDLFFAAIRGQQDDNLAIGGSTVTEMKKQLAV